MESYFLPGYNILRQADRLFGNLVAASIKTTLHNVVKVLRKEVDLSLETDPGDNAGFEMNFELDSNLRTDNDDTMRFEDPATLSNDTA